MAKKADSKLRILYVRDMISARHGEEQGITMADILGELAERQIYAERKSIYDDLRTLELYGLPLGRAYGGKTCRYYLR